MTELEKYLKSVKERCEKATEGPWVLNDRNNVIQNSNKAEVAESYYTNDADFIATSRTDVQRLLDIIEVLEINLSDVMKPETFQRVLKHCEKIAKGEYGD